MTDDDERWAHFIPRTPAPVTRASTRGTRRRAVGAGALLLVSLLGLGEAADLGLNDGDATRSILSMLGDAPGAAEARQGLDSTTGHARGYTDGAWAAQRDDTTSTLVPEGPGSMAESAGDDPRASNPQHHFSAFDDAAARAARTQSAPVPTLDPAAAVGTVDASGRPVNYAADDRGHPVSGMDGVDLDGISPGGGRGPVDHDWSKIGAYELSMPGANLTVGLVDKGVRRVGPHTVSMELPVSFQAAVLDTAAPISAARGTSVVAGHVNWADGSWAPMSNLYASSVGMPLSTSDGHGGVQRWKVVKRSYVDQDRLSSTFSITDRQGPRRLLMITCKASVVDGRTVYDRNLVVEAVPVR